MATKARRRRRGDWDFRLKIAIIESQRTQRRVARATGIGEVRLSAFVRGRLRPTPIEQRRLAKYLGREIADLFPTPPAEPGAPEGAPNGGDVTATSSL
jgi:transcriptional regulator with XRE-family HTH domain